MDGQQRVPLIVKPVLHDVLVDRGLIHLANLCLLVHVRPNACLQHVVSRQIWVPHLRYDLNELGI